jgi:predicted RNA methylase
MHSIGMTPKKLVEVQAVSKIIHASAQSSCVTKILDLGAGQGHLDIILALHFGYTVIGVDDDKLQTCGAARKANAATSRYPKDGITVQFLSLRSFKLVSGQ